MFTVSLEAEGLEKAERMLDILRAMGSRVGSVELHTRKRADSEATNIEILGYLQGTGRDFITSSTKDREAIASEFAKEVERRLGGKDLSAASIVDMGGEVKSKASELAAAALTMSMKEYMRQVSNRIDNGLTNEPPFNNDLNKEYADYKKKAVGFTHPIGKFTGQLIDNLNPDGTGARNIRLRKS